MKRIPIFWASAALWMAVLATVAPAAAQQRPQRRVSPGQTQEAQARLTRRFLDHATSELNLSVEQRGGLESVLQETMKRRRELAERQFRLRRQIREALSDPSTEDGEFRRLAEEATAIKRQELELLEWQNGRLAEVLTPRQALRFSIMQERLARQVQSMRRGRRQ